MASEAEIITAFLFKRSGKEKMSFSELYLDLSMNLNWFSPDDAKRFLNDAIKKSLLKKEGDQISLLFDINQVKIPVGFSPSKKVLSEKKSPEIAQKLGVFEQILKRIQEKTNLEKQQIIDKINGISKEKNVIEEIAALLVGKEFEIELNDFLQEAEKKIINNM